MRRTLYELLGALVFVAAVLLLIFWKGEVHFKREISIPKDTAVSKVDSQTTRVGVITITDSNQLYTIQSRDSLILTLREEIAKYKGQLSSAVALRTETKIRASGKTIVVDSIPRHDSVLIFPTYKSEIQNKWYTALMIMNQDSSELNLIMHDEYEVFIGRENGKWFADVKNHNPNSSTSYIRAIQVNQPTIKNSRWKVGPIGGIGYQLPNKFGLFIGVGATYNLLKQ